MTDEIGHAHSDELADIAKQVVAEQIPAILDNYRRNPAGGAEIEPAQPEEIAIEADADIAVKLSDIFVDRDWSDGMPIVPPTVERVDAMLRASGLKGDELLAVLPPRGGRATAKKVAVCAVMAGCDAVHFPIVAAAVHAIAQRNFQLYMVQTTAHPLYPFILVNGPIGKKAGLSNGHDLTPRGWKANLVIARALRLVCISTAGIKALQASHTHGYVGYHDSCIRENEEDSPWEAFHVEKGYPKEANVVTAFPAEPPHVIDDRGSTTPQSLLSTFAMTVASPGNRSIWANSEQVFLVCPEHARYLASQNFSKGDIKEFLYHVARVPLHQFPKHNLASLAKWRQKIFSNVSEHVTLPVVRSMEDFEVVVHGGVGPHSMWLAGCPVSRGVTVDVDKLIHDISRKR